MGSRPDRTNDGAESITLRICQILLRWSLAFALGVMSPVAVTTVSSNLLTQTEEHETSHEASFRAHSEGVRLERSMARALQEIPCASTEPGTARKGISPRLVCNGHRLSNGVCAPLLC